MSNDLSIQEQMIQDLQNQVRDMETQLQKAQAAKMSSAPEGHSANNPHPVLCVSTNGIILYRNAAAASRKGWKCEIDEMPPMPLRALVTEALAENRPVEQEILLDGKSYAVSVVPVPEDCCVSVYGIDITEHKKTESALAESEKRQREISRLLEMDQARLAAVLRHMPVGVWIVDQQGRLLGSNPEADRIWGGNTPSLNSIDDYRKFSSYEPNSGELLPPQQHPIVRALQTHELVQSHELKICGFDSSLRTVLASAAPIKDNHGRLMGVVGVNVDISELKQMEDALRRSEERLAKAFHATPDAIVISRMSDGLIYEVNDGWQKLFGHQPGDVIGKTSIALGIYVRPEDRTEIMARLQKNGFLHDFEIQVRRKSGEVRQASLSVELLEIEGVRCWLTILRDITERKRSEQALRESEWRLKRTQEIAHLGSWELDLINDRLTWSDEVYRIFGLEPQQFAATYDAFLEAVHPEDRIAVDTAYSSSIQAGQDTYEIVHRVIRPSSGEVRIVHEKCEHFRNQDGKILRSIGMVHDITERKLAEEALAKSTA